MGPDPQCVIVNEPTRGIDVGAKADIHRVIRGLAADGASILVFSSELPELISLCDQTVEVAGHSIPFRRGEVVTTECSHKYTLDGFAALAARAGFAVDRVWTDDRRWFSVQLLRSE